MIADRCRRPADDLLAKLIELEVDGEELTVDDIRSFVADSGSRRRLAPRVLRVELVEQALHRRASSARSSSRRRPLTTGRSMSATRPPASAISACPRFVRSMSLARPSAGSGRRVRYPRSTRSFTNSDAAARLSCARSASSVSRMPPIRMLPKIWKCVSRTSPYPASARGAARSSRNSRNNLTSSCPIARRSGGRSLDVAMACEDTTDTEVSVSEVNGDTAMITPSPISSAPTSAGCTSDAAGPARRLCCGTAFSSTPDPGVH